MVLELEDFLHKYDFTDNEINHITADFCSANKNKFFFLTLNNLL